MAPLPPLHLVASAPRSKHVWRAIYQAHVLPAEGASYARALLQGSERLAEHLLRPLAHRCAPNAALLLGAQTSSAEGATLCTHARAHAHRQIVGRSCHRRWTDSLTASRGVVSESSDMALCSPLSSAPARGHCARGHHDKRQPGLHAAQGAGMGSHPHRMRRASRLPAASAAAVWRGQAGRGS